MSAINALRDAFSAEQWHPLGASSPIVPLPFGNDRVGRLAARHIAEAGIFANLVEYPAVPVGGARLRMQVMASHTPEHAKLAAATVIKARAAAEEELQDWSDVTTFKPQDGTIPK